MDPQLIQVGGFAIVLTSFRPGPVPSLCQPPDLPYDDVSIDQAPSAEIQQEKKVALNFARVL